MKYIKTLFDDMLAKIVPRDLIEENVSDECIKKVARNRLVKRINKVCRKQIKKLKILNMNKKHHVKKIS